VGRKISPRGAHINTRYRNSGYRSWPLKGQLQEYRIVPLEGYDTGVLDRHLGGADTGVPVTGVFALWCFDFFHRVDHDFSPATHLPT
jgi:hypothetical protein